MTDRDQRGNPIGPSRPLQPTEVLHAIEDTDTDTDTSPAALREPCPACGSPRSADDRFCESCGRDFQAPPPHAVAWELIATADREHFERFPAAGVTFPADFVARRFVLKGPQLRVGRSSGDGTPTPEIDLAGAPEDRGISRLHACLERQADGSYAVRDLGSTNGTTVNDTPVGIDQVAALAPGDRIRIGAWTTLTVRSF